MGKNKGYFQFPLCLLSFGKNDKERLQAIVSYCLCEEAKRRNPKFLKSARNASLDEAATFLGVTVGSHDSAIRRWKDAERFVREWERRYGEDALIRIGTVLLWEAHNNTGVSYREFSVLCAINSIIGSRHSVPKRITEPSVRVRAAGYKSWKIAEAKLPSAESRKERLLTPDQVRYTLKMLHQRKFFARARVGAKTVKYMLRVTDDELRGRLLQSETYQPRFQADRAKKDAELMAAIRSIKQKPINVGKGQSEAVSLPTQSPHGNDIIPNMVPDINSCSFNTSASNSGPENISKRNKAPLSVESGVIDSLRKAKSKQLDRSAFNAEELAFIDLYHQICLPAELGFLPVTHRSQELDKVLEIFPADFDEKEWTERFREAVEYRREIFRTNPCKYNTLVQICWKLNY